jgi:acyl-CoA thioesterase
MQSDIEFLGLAGDERDPGKFSFTVVDRLCRLDGALYGGTAIAVSVAAAEITSGANAVWMTTQFVSSVRQDTTVDVRAEVLAGGRRTKQVRVTGTSPTGDVVFASLGSTAEHRPNGLAGVFDVPPTVTSPEESPTHGGPFRRLAEARGLDPDELPEMPEPKVGWALVTESRSAEILDHPDPGAGRICTWTRRKDGGPITPAMAAYMADMVPMGVSNALGVIAAGTSLDNSIRIGSFVDTEWVLLDIRPHMAAGGYGHGIVHVWSEDGHLLATASQTASMFTFNLDSPPWAVQNP